MQQREKEKAREQAQAHADRRGARWWCVLALAAVIGVVAANGGKDEQAGSGGPRSRPSGATGKDSLAIPVGAADAPSTLTVYEDFRCPACDAVRERRSARPIHELEDSGQLQGRVPPGHDHRRQPRRQRLAATRPTPPPAPRTPASSARTTTCSTRNQPDETDDNFADKKQPDRAGGQGRRPRHPRLHARCVERRHARHLGQEVQRRLPERPASSGTPTVLLNGKNIYGDRATALTHRGKPEAAGQRRRTRGKQPAKVTPAPTGVLTRTAARRGGAPDDRLVIQTVAGRVAVRPARHGSVDPAMDLALHSQPVARRASTSDPIPLRGYAFCIIIGVFVAVWLGNKRWIARGGRSGTVADIAVWAVPFGLVGGRLYHVITDYELYFSDGKDWVDAFKIWEGGLGIWGAIALGAVGAWIGCRRRGIPLPAYADALAPGIALAQAIGRWGNWFNQELYGKPTDLPWAPEDRRRTPADRRRRRHLPPDLPVRVAVVRRRRAAGDLGRPPLQARARAGLRALRRRVQRGPGLDRVHAGRRRPPHPGPAAERLDRADRLRRSRWPTS